LKCTGCKQFYLLKFEALPTASSAAIILAHSKQIETTTPTVQSIDYQF